MPNTINKLSKQVKTKQNLVDQLMDGDIDNQVKAGDTIYGQELFKTFTDFRKAVVTDKELPEKFKTERLKEILDYLNKIGTSSLELLGLGLEVELQRFINMLDGDNDDYTATGGESFVDIAALIFKQDGSNITVEELFATNKHLFPNENDSNNIQLTAGQKLQAPGNTFVFSENDLVEFDLNVSANAVTLNGQSLQQNENIAAYKKSEITPILTKLINDKKIDYEQLGIALGFAPLMNQNELTQLKILKGKAYTQQIEELHTNLKILKPGAPNYKDILKFQEEVNTNQNLVPPAKIRLLQKTVEKFVHLDFANQAESIVDKINGNISNENTLDNAQIVLKLRADFEEILVKNPHFTDSKEAGGYDLSDVKKIDNTLAFAQRKIDFCTKVLERTSEIDNLDKKTKNLFFVHKGHIRIDCKHWAGRLGRFEDKYVNKDKKFWYKDFGFDSPEVAIAVLNENRVYFSSNGKESAPIKEKQNLKLEGWKKDFADKNKKEQEAYNALFDAQQAPNSVDAERATSDRLSIDYLNTRAASITKISNITGDFEDSDIFKDLDANGFPADIAYAGFLQGVMVNFNDFNWKSSNGKKEENIAKEGIERTADNLRATKTIMDSLENSAVNLTSNIADIVGPDAVKGVMDKTDAVLKTKKIVLESNLKAAPNSAAKKLSEVSDEEIRTILGLKATDDIPANSKTAITQYIQTQLRLTEVNNRYHQDTRTLFEITANIGVDGYFSGIKGGESWQNSDFLDQEVAVEMAVETAYGIKNYEDLFTFTKDTLYTIKNADFHSSKNESTYRAVTERLKNILVERARFECRPDQDGKINADKKAQLFLDIANLITDRAWGNKISSYIEDPALAVDLLQEGMNFQLLVEKQKGHSPLRTKTIALKTKLLSKINNPDLLGRTVSKDETKILAYKTDALKDTNMEMLSEQFGLLRTLEIQMKRLEYIKSETAKGIKAKAIDFSEKSNLDYPTPAEIANEVTKDTGSFFAEGIEAISQQLNQNGIVFGDTRVGALESELGVTIDLDADLKQKAMYLLSDIQGAGYWNMSDDKVAQSKEYGKMAAMIAASIAVGVLTGGAGAAVLGSVFGSTGAAVGAAMSTNLLAAGLTTGAVMTGMDIALNQRGFDSWQEGLTHHATGFVTDGLGGSIGARFSAGATRGLFVSKEVGKAILKSTAREGAEAVAIETAEGFGKRAINTFAKNRAGQGLRLGLKSMDSKTFLAVNQMDEAIGRFWPQLFVETAIDTALPFEAFKMIVQEQKSFGEAWIANATDPFNWLMAAGMAGGMRSFGRVRSAIKQKSFRALLQSAKAAPGFEKTLTDYQTSKNKFIRKMKEDLAKAGIKKAKARKILRAFQDKTGNKKKKLIEKYPDIAGIMDANQAAFDSVQGQFEAFLIESEHLLELSTSDLITGNTAGAGATANIKPKNKTKASYAEAKKSAEAALKPYELSATEVLSPVVVAAKLQKHGQVTFPDEATKQRVVQEMTNKTAEGGTDVIRKKVFVEMSDLVFGLDKKTISLKKYNELPDGFDIDAAVQKTDFDVDTDVDTKDLAPAKKAAIKKAHEAHLSAEAKRIELQSNAADIETRHQTIKAKQKEFTKTDRSEFWKKHEKTITTAQPGFTEKDLNQLLDKIEIDKNGKLVIPDEYKSIDNAIHDDLKALKKNYDEAYKPTPAERKNWRRNSLLNKEQKFAAVAEELGLQSLTDIQKQRLNMAHMSSEPEYDKNKNIIGWNGEPKTDANGEYEYSKIALKRKFRILRGLTDENGNKIKPTDPKRVEVFTVAQTHHITRHRHAGLLELAHAIGTTPFPGMRIPFTNAVILGGNIVTHQNLAQNSMIRARGGGLIMQITLNNNQVILTPIGGGAATTLSRLEFNQQAQTNNWRRVSYRNNEIGKNWRRREITNRIKKSTDLVSKLTGVADWQGIGSIQLRKRRYKIRRHHQRVQRMLAGNSRQNDSISPQQRTNLEQLDDWFTQMDVELTRRIALPENRGIAGLNKSMFPDGDLYAISNGLLTAPHSLKRSRNPLYNLSNRLGGIVIWREIAKYWDNKKGSSQVPGRKHWMRNTVYTHLNHARSINSLVKNVLKEGNNGDIGTATANEFANSLRNIPLQAGVEGRTNRYANATGLGDLSLITVEGKLRALLKDNAGMKRNLNVKRGDGKKRQTDEVAVLVAQEVKIKTMIKLIKSEIELRKKLVGFEGDTAVPKITTEELKTARKEARVLATEGTKKGQSLKIDNLNRVIRDMTGPPWRFDSFITHYQKLLETSDATECTLLFQRVEAVERAVDGITAHTPAAVAVTLRAKLVLANGNLHRHCMESLLNLTRGYIKSGYDYSDQTNKVGKFELDKTSYGNDGYSLLSTKDIEAVEGFHNFLARTLNTLYHPAGTPAHDLIAFWIDRDTWPAPIAHPPGDPIYQDNRAQSGQRLIEYKDTPSSAPLRPGIRLGTKFVPKGYHAAGALPGVNLVGPALRAQVGGRITDEVVNNLRIPNDNDRWKKFLAHIDASQDAAGANIQDQLFNDMLTEVTTHLGPPAAIYSNGYRQRLFFLNKEYMQGRIDALPTGTDQRTLDELNRLLADHPRDHADFVQEMKMALINAHYYGAMQFARMTPAQWDQYQATGMGGLTLGTIRSKVRTMQTDNFWPNYLVDETIRSGFAGQYETNVDELITNLKQLIDGDLGGGTKLPTQNKPKIALLKRINASEAMIAYYRMLADTDQTSQGWKEDQEILDKLDPIKTTLETGLSPSEISESQQVDIGAPDNKPLPADPKAAPAADKNLKPWAIAANKAIEKANEGRQVAKESSSDKIKDIENRGLINRKPLNELPDKEQIHAHKNVFQSLDETVKRLKDPTKWEEIKGLGLTLAGPPDTGKTYIARGFAKEVGGEYWEINSSMINRGSGPNGAKYSGETWAKVNDIFSAAEAFREENPDIPLVIFADEITSLFKKPTAQNSEDNATGLEDFKARTDSLVKKGIFVIGCTNHIDKVQAEILSKKRLGYKVIPVLPPYAVKDAFGIMSLSEKIFKQTGITDFDFTEINQTAFGQTVEQRLEDIAYVTGMDISSLFNDALATISSITPKPSKTEQIRIFNESINNAGNVKRSLKNKRADEIEMIKTALESNSGTAYDKNEINNYDLANRNTLEIDGNIFKTGKKITINKVRCTITNIDRKNNKISFTPVGADAATRQSNISIDEFKKILVKDYDYPTSILNGSNPSNSPAPTTKPTQTAAPEFEATWTVLVTNHTQVNADYILGHQILDTKNNISYDIIDIDEHSIKLLGPNGEEKTMSKSVIKGDENISIKTLSFDEADVQTDRMKNRANPEASKIQQTKLLDEIKTKNIDLTQYETTRHGKTYTIEKITDDDITIENKKNSKKSTIELDEFSKDITDGSRTITKKIIKKVRHPDRIKNEKLNSSPEKQKTSNENLARINNRTANRFEIHQGHTIDGKDQTQILHVQSRDGQDDTEHIKLETPSGAITPMQVAHIRTGINDKSVLVERTDPQALLANPLDTNLQQTSAELKIVQNDTKDNKHLQINYRTDSGQDSIMRTPATKFDDAFPNDVIEINGQIIFKDEIDALVKSGKLRFEWIKTDDSVSKIEHEAALTAAKRENEAKITAKAKEVKTAKEAQQRAEAEKSRINQEKEEATRDKKAAEQAKKEAVVAKEKANKEKLNANEAKQIAEAKVAASEKHQVTQDAVHNYFLDPDQDLDTDKLAAIQTAIQTLKSNNDTNNQTAFIAALTLHVQHVDLSIYQSNPELTLRLASQIQPIIAMRQTYKQRVETVIAEKDKAQAAEIQAKTEADKAKKIAEDAKIADLQ